jgi:MFS family permease
MLLLVLPIGSKLVARKLGDNPIRRDLYLARISIHSIALGCLLAAIAYTPPLIIVGFVFYGIGAGFVSQLRALVTGIVEPHTLATLNTMISSMETIMGSIGAPAFGWLMSRGMELGGAWLGLPYLATTGFAILSCILLWFFRIPHAFL